MKRIHKIIIVATLMLSAVILGVQAHLSKNSPDNQSLNFVDFLPTPIIDQNINKIFFDQTIDPLPNDLNTGITVERLKTLALNGIPTPAPNYISPLVLNHTDEPIRFENIGFNIKVFQYNSETNIWEKVLLPYIPEKTQKILPPKLEKFDFEIWNSWELRDNDLINVRSNAIRIFISGVGALSNNNYGAYIDLTLVR